MQDGLAGGWICKRHSRIHRVPTEPPQLTDFFRFFRFPGGGGEVDDDDSTSGVVRECGLTPFIFGATGTSDTLLERAPLGFAGLGSARKDSSAKFKDEELAYLN